MPSETAKHHKAHILSLTQQALTDANIKPNDVDAIAFTKGPGMGGFYFLFLFKFQRNTEINYNNQGEFCCCCFCC